MADTATSLVRELVAAGQPVPPELTDAAHRETQLLGAPEAGTEGTPTNLQSGPTMAKVEDMQDLARVSGERALNEMNPVARRMAAVGAGTVNDWNTIGHKLGLVSDSDFLRTRLMDLAPAAQHPFLHGTGEALPFMIPGANVGEAVGAGALATDALAPAARALATNTLLRGAAEGAAQGSLLGDNPLEGGIEGMLGGAALPGVVSGGRRAISGLDIKPEARALIDRFGVSKMRLTPGQMLGGAWGSLEDTLRPVIPGLSGARRSSMEDLTRNLIEEHAAPAYTDAGVDMPRATIDRDLPITGSAGQPSMYGEAAASYDPLYNSVRPYPWIPRMDPTSYGQPMADAIADAARAGGTGVSTKARTRLGQAALDSLTGFPSTLRPNVQATAGDAMDARSALRELARGQALDTNAQRAQNRLMRGMANRFTTSLEGQLPDDALDALRAGDTEYARLMSVQDALINRKNGASYFTPHQYLRSAEDRYSPAQLLTGHVDPDVDAARNLAALTREDPETGWSLAKLAMLSGVGAITGVTEPHLIAGAAALGAPAYTQAGRRLISGTSWPQRFAQNRLGIGRGVAGPQGDALRAIEQRIAPATSAPGVEYVKRGYLGTKDTLPAEHGAAAPQNADPLELQGETAVPHAKGGKVGVVMHEWGQGKLHSGSKQGPLVGSQKQAVAIALSEARKAGEHVPAKHAEGGEVTADRSHWDDLADKLRSVLGIPPAGHGVITNGPDGKPVDAMAEADRES
jgi:hypothetical protein